LDDAVRTVIFDNNWAAQVMEKNAVFDVHWNCTGV
jgi:hypothetical protein